MSCTPEFVRANTYAGTPNDNYAKNTAIPALTGARVGNNCTGITMGNRNHYSSLLSCTNDANQFNTNLIGSCIDVNTPVGTQFTTIKDIQSGGDQSLQQLQKEEKEAKLRLELLRSSNSTVTNHQVFLLGRPLRPASIPLLWALSVLFIGIAALIFYTFSPFEIIPSNYILFQIYLFLINPYFIASALLIAVISVIVATLHITGTI